MLDQISKRLGEIVGLVIILLLLVSMPLFPIAGIYWLIKSFTNPKNRYIYILIGIIGLIWPFFALQLIGIFFGGSIF